MEKCQDCGNTVDVHNGRCPACRRTHAGHQDGYAEGSGRREPDIEPRRNEPWVPRSGFVGRHRRNPRK